MDQISIFKRRRADSLRWEARSDARVRYGILHEGLRSLRSTFVGTELHCLGQLYYIYTSNLVDGASGYTEKVVLIGFSAVVSSGNIDRERNGK